VTTQVAVVASAVVMALAAVDNLAVQVTRAWIEWKERPSSRDGGKS
jgi:hypothetical protein